MASAATSTAAETQQQGSAGMKEVERKFLLSRPVDVTDLECTTIEQHYVALDATTGSEVRVRKRVDNKKVATHTLTIKGKGGMERTEVEFEISAAQFAMLALLSAGRTVEKTRALHTPRGSAVTWEIDTFHKPKLDAQVVEVEFPTKVTSPNH
jgi:CYTH domain-containing protein